MSLNSNLILSSEFKVKTGLKFLSSDSELLAQNQNFRGLGLSVSSVTGSEFQFDFYQN